MIRNIYSLSCCCIYTKNEERRKIKTQQAKPTYNLLVNIVAFIRESYLFCESYKC